MNKTALLLFITSILFIMSCMTINGSDSIIQTTTSQEGTGDKIIRTNTIHQVETYSPVPSTFYQASASCLCEKCIYYFDKDIWDVTRQQGEMIELSNRRVNQCVVFTPWAGGGFDEHDKQNIIHIGRHNWQYVEARNNYRIYIFLDNMILDDPTGNIIFSISYDGIEGSQQQECIKDFYSILSTIDSLETPLASVIPMPTFTPIPPVKPCQGAPASFPYLVGDGFTIVRQVYLRKTPEKVNDNIILLLEANPYNDMSGWIIGGPECGEFPGGGYLYWKVRLQDGTIGWIAEGDNKGKYIEYVHPPM